MDRAYGWNAWDGGYPIDASVKRRGWPVDAVSGIGWRVGAGNGERPCTACEGTGPFGLGSGVYLTMRAGMPRVSPSGLTKSLPLG